MSDFWDRWSKDYLLHLNRFNKCHQPQRSITVGDIVLVKDTDLFICSWPLARVIQTHPGDDGLVRVATVRTQKETYRRAIHKLVQLVEEATFSPGGCSGSNPPPPLRVRDRICARLPQVLPSWRLSMSRF